MDKDLEAGKRVRAANLLVSGEHVSGASIPARIVDDAMIKSICICQERPCLLSMKEYVSRYYRSSPLTGSSFEGIAITEDTM
jgi:hypothetical protein